MTPKMSTEKSIQESEEVNKVSLLDWKALRNPHLQRWRYTVENVSSFIFPNILNNPVNEGILNYLYTQATPSSVKRCQQYYFFGIEGAASVVCEKCLPSARFAVFSIFNSAYINFLHAHIHATLQCHHCNKKMESISASRCETGRNESDVITIEPRYRCLRVSWDIE